jgi:hypothetical protein
VPLLEGVSGELFRIAFSFLSYNVFGGHFLWSGEREREREMKNDDLLNRGEDR